VISHQDLLSILEYTCIFYSCIKQSIQLCIRIFQYKTILVISFQVKVPVHVSLDLDPHSQNMIWTLLHLFIEIYLNFAKSNFSLGKVTLISRLSSRVTKKYRAGRIWFYFIILISPKKNYWWQFCFYSQKWCHSMLLTHVLDVSNRYKNFKYKYHSRTQKFSRKCNFYKIKKIGVGQFLRGGQGW
jgi:hypothetical protein